MWEHFIGPGSIKTGLQIVNHLTGGKLNGAVEVMSEITSSPAYTKYRIDNARESISDFWDDHKEAVGEFFENIGDTVSDGLSTAGDAIGDTASTMIDILGGIF